MAEELKKLMATYVKYPPGKVQSISYDGPITLSGYQKFEWMCEQLKKGGTNIQLPHG